MMTQTLKKLFYTLQPLQKKQLFYQVYYRCFKPSPRALSPQPHVIRPWQNSTWQAPKLTVPILSTSGEISLLGETVCMHEPELWNSPKHAKLWLYNIHYFDVLNTTNTSKHTTTLHAFIERWIHDNPPCQGNGWEPYPLSLRIVNFIKWFLMHPDQVKPNWLASLEMQARALAKQTEYHILANHLFANGKALVFYGAYIQSKMADAYFKKGLRILDKEIDEQFLNDGGHFELSPMYHTILLWDLCDLVNLAQLSGLLALQKRALKWQGIIKKAIHWLDVMSHPDGGISFFNDAAFDIAPSLPAVRHYAKQLGIPAHQYHTKTDANTPFTLQHLKDSGYIAVLFNQQDKAILDVAKLGPDYQPGHGHADTLSFELTLHGQRFLVNSGTSTYTQGAQRQHERSTKAHNTVNVDHQNSSEVWSGFRVARRAYPKNLHISAQEQQLTISGSHNGYARLPGKNTHTRTWTFSRQTLTLHDIITGKFEDAESRLYFHPDVHVVLQHNTVQCSFEKNNDVSITIEGATSLLLEPATWHPHFGVSVNNTCLVATFSGQSLLTRIQWSG